MVLRVNEVGVDASLLDLHVHILLNLLQLGLLNSGAILLVQDLRVDAFGVESHGLHGSHLHSQLVADLGGVEVGLYHGAQGVLAHVVVHLDVVTLQNAVAVELHLLTSDA